MEPLERRRRGFLFTSPNHETLTIRNKDFQDKATPSGNSIAADVLLKLGKITGNKKYERYAVTVPTLVLPQIKRYPNGFGRTLSTLEFHLDKLKEIIMTGYLAN